MPDYNKCEIVSTPEPDEVEFRVWARDSGCHIDLTVDVVDVTLLTTDPVSDTVTMYHGKACHPANQDECDTNYEIILTKITNGDALPDCME